MCKGGVRMMEKGLHYNYIQIKNQASEVDEKEMPDGLVFSIIIWKPLNYVICERPLTEC